MRPVQRRLTYPELRLLPDDGRRHELIDGALFVNGEKVSLDTYPHETEPYVSPSPSERHQRISSRLYVAIYLHVESKKLGRVYYAPFDVVFSEKTALQPDILFVSRARLGIIGPEYVLGPPDLVVEILSPQRASFDRVTKFEQYGQYGVGEYWIVDPLAEKVEIYRLVETDYQLKGPLGGDDVLDTPLLPGWKLPVRDLFAD